MITQRREPVGPIVHDNSVIPPTTLYDDLWPLVMISACLYNEWEGTSTHSSRLAGRGHGSERRTGIITCLQWCTVLSLGSSLIRSQKGFLLLFRPGLEMRLARKLLTLASCLLLPGWNGVGTHHRGLPLGYLLISRLERVVNYMVPCKGPHDYKGLPPPPPPNTHTHTHTHTSPHLILVY